MKGAAAGSIERKNNMLFKDHIRGKDMTSRDTSLQEEELTMLEKARILLGAGSTERIRTGEGDDELGAEKLMMLAKPRALLGVRNKVMANSETLNRRQPFFNVESSMRRVQQNESFRKMKAGFENTKLRRSEKQSRRDDSLQEFQLTMQEKEKARVLLGTGSTENVRTGEGDDLMSAEKLLVPEKARALLCVGNTVMANSKTLNRRELFLNGKSMRRVKKNSLRKLRVSFEEKILRHSRRQSQIKSGSAVEMSGEMGSFSKTEGEVLIIPREGNCREFSSMGSPKGYSSNQKVPRESNCREFSSMASPKGYSANHKVFFKFGKSDEPVKEPDSEKPTNHNITSYYSVQEPGNEKPTKLKSAGDKIGQESDNEKPMKPDSTGREIVKESDHKKLTTLNSNGDELGIDSDIEKQTKLNRTGHEQDKELDQKKPTKPSKVGDEQGKEPDNIMPMKINKNSQATEKGTFASSVKKMSLGPKKPKTLKPHVNLQQFCLSTPLHNLCKKTIKNITKEDVKEIKCLTRKIKSLTKTQDGAQNTPLHYACLMGLEFSVIDALLLANPEACLVKNSVGSLPLHNAFKCDACDPSVIRALYESYPEAIRSKDKYGRTPSFYDAKATEMLDKIQSLKT